MKIFSNVLAALQISGISADSFQVKADNVVKGFKINNQAFATGMVAVRSQKKP